MTKGTIVLTPFPFTDLSSIKRRPAVIISASDKPGEDVILAFISSNVSNPVQKTDYILDSDHTDFGDTGLKKSSAFKMDKLVTIKKSILKGEIGRVSPTILKELDDRLKITFGLS